MNMKNIWITAKAIGMSRCEHSDMNIEILYLLLLQLSTLSWKPTINFRCGAPDVFRLFCGYFFVQTLNMGIDWINLWRNWNLYVLIWMPTSRCCCCSFQPRGERRQLAMWCGLLGYSRPCRRKTHNALLSEAASINGIVSYVAELIL